MRKHSTLVERAMFFSIKPLDSAKLEKGVESFREYLSGEQNVSFDFDAKHLWNYSLTEDKDDEGPIITNRRTFPEYTFTVKNSQNAFLWRLLVNNSKIVFNFGKNSLDDPGSWKEFLKTALEYIHVLQKKLEVPSLEELTITYLFAYNNLSLDDPELIKPEWLEVRKLLQPFETMRLPASFKAFAPIYTWDQQWICSRPDKLDYTVISSIETSQTKNDASKNMPLTVFLYLGVIVPNKCLKEDDVRYDDIHALLKESYELMLTDYSRKKLAGDFK